MPSHSLAAAETAFRTGEVDGEDFYDIDTYPLGIRLRPTNLFHMGTEQSPNGNVFHSLVVLALNDLEVKSSTFFLLIS